MTSVLTGCPSPTHDYSDTKIDLSEMLIRDQVSTFIATVSGGSMEGAGISDGEDLIVDRSAKPRDGHVVITARDRGMTLGVWPRYVCTDNIRAMASDTRFRSAAAEPVTRDNSGHRHQAERQVKPRRAPDENAGFHMVFNDPKYSAGPVNESLDGGGG